MSVTKLLRSSSKGKLTYCKHIDAIKLKDDLSQLSPPPLSRLHVEQDISSVNASFGVECHDTLDNSGLQAEVDKLSLSGRTVCNDPGNLTTPKSRYIATNKSSSIHHGSENNEDATFYKSPTGRFDKDTKLQPVMKGSETTTSCVSNKSPVMSPPVSPDSWGSVRAIMEVNEIYESRAKWSQMERKKQHDDHNRALGYLMKEKQKDVHRRLKSIKEKRQSSVERTLTEEKEESEKTLQNMRKYHEEQKEKMDSKQKEIEQRRVLLETEEKKRQEEYEKNMQLLGSLLRQVDENRSKFIQIHASYQNKDLLPEDIAKCKAVLEKVCASLPAKFQNAVQSGSISSEIMSEFQDHVEKSQRVILILNKHIDTVDAQLKANAEKAKEQEIKRAEEKKKAENLKAEVANNFGVQALSYALKEKESNTELLAKVEASINGFVTNKETQIKQYRFDLQRAVNTPINAISGVASRHLCDKLHKLLILLRGQEVEVSNRRVKADRTPESMLFCQNLVAKMLVKKAEEQVSSHHESAFPMAAVLLGLWCEFPMVGTLFLAHLQARCPYVLPYYHTRVEGETSTSYHSALGYKVEEDGTVEEQDKFLRRMSGLMRLYCACLVTEPPPPTPGWVDSSTRPPPGHTLYPHPHGVEHAWGWLARCLNQDPHPDVTATLLHDVLASSGFWLLQRYSVQFVKMVYLLFKQYLPKLSEVAVTGAAVGRLQIFLEKSLGSGRIGQPEGALRQGFWRGM